MTITALDTHEIVKDLTSAGFTESQAEAVTRWVRKSRDLDLANLATKTDLQLGLATAKADLDATKIELQASISTTKAELQASIAGTKADILKRVVGTVGFQTVVMLGGLVALARIIAH